MLMEQSFHLKILSAHENDCLEGCQTMISMYSNGFVHVIQTEQLGIY